MRPELLALLPHAGLAPEQLLTLDDLDGLDDVGARLAPERTRWVLVDHNALQGVLGEVYAGIVVGCIDHHEEEGRVPRETGEEPRIVTKAGSCNSLVVEFVREMWDALAEGRGEERRQWDAQVARLALASVLIDTHALRDKGKTTEHDVWAAGYLEGKIKAARGTGVEAETEFDREKFFEEIKAAKEDFSGFTVRDALRKDYKEWSERGMKVGISSVVKPLPFLHDMARKEADGGDELGALRDSMRKFAEERKLSTYGLMTTSTSADGQFQRELMVWATKPEAVSAVKAFAQGAREELGLEDWSGPDVGLENVEGEREWRRTWWQRNLQLSRKKVAPLLRRAMNSK